MFREFWNYTFTESASKYFKRWYFLACHSKLKAIISAAKTFKGKPFWVKVFKTKAYSYRVSHKNNGRKGCLGTLSANMRIMYL